MRLQKIILPSKLRGLEVEEDVSTVATQYRAEGVWTGKW